MGVCSAFHQQSQCQTWLTGLSMLISWQVLRHSLLCVAHTIGHNLMEIYKNTPVPTLLYPRMLKWSLNTPEATYIPMLISTTYEWLTVLLSVDLFESRGFKMYFSAFWWQFGEQKG